MQVPSKLAWSRNELVTLACIVGIGVALRVGAAIVIASPLESDYLGYWTMANNLLRDHVLADTDGQPTAFLNVGYPLFLWTVLSLAGSSIACAKAANVVLGGAAILLVYASARALFRSRRIAALSALLLAVYLEAIVYTAYVAKENLLILLLMAQLALVAGCVRRRWLPVNAAAFGVATGCVAMVGNAGLLLLPGLLAQILFATERAAAALRYLAIAAPLAILTTVPLLIRNHEVFGVYTLNNNGGFNLYIGNNPNATLYFESIVETPIGPEWQHERARLGESGIDVMLRGLAVEYIIQHPIQTMERALRRSLAFWAPPFDSGKAAGGTLERLVRTAWSLEYCAICGLFLAAAILRRRAGRAWITLWLMVAGYTAIHMAFYVMARYRLPIMPVLCVGAGVGLDLVLLWRGARKRASTPEPHSAVAPPFAVSVADSFADAV